MTWRRTILLVVLAVAGCKADPNGMPPRPYYVSYTKTLPDVVRRAADAGEAGAQTALGHFYERGENGFAVREDEALRLYRLAAAQGYPPALTNLAVLVATGRGVARDDAEAARLLSLAAQQDYEPAQVYLAACYLAHRGQIADGDAVAIAALRAVAAREMGSNHCRHVRIVVGLAQLSRDGAPGVPREQAEAIRLLKKMAAPRGSGCDDENAKAQLAKMPANPPLDRQ